MLNAAEIKKDIAEAEAELSVMEQKRGLLKIMREVTPSQFLWDDMRAMYKDRDIQREATNKEIKEYFIEGEGIQRKMFFPKSYSASATDAWHAVGLSNGLILIQSPASGFMPLIVEDCELYTLYKEADERGIGATLGDREFAKKVAEVCVSRKSKFGYKSAQNFLLANNRYQHMACQFSDEKKEELKEYESSLNRAGLSVRYKAMINMVKFDDYGNPLKVKKKAYERFYKMARVEIAHLKNGGELADYNFRQTWD